ncbi:MAG: molybdenum cofactor guanylyltransferase MobA [Brucellaceae bacterium]|nr:molybdenum cofactor guanylyltransferase MobA [Brucellaceae bacterium]
MPAPLPLTETPARPAGLILAGGRSSRMGGTDKALLQLGGKSLVARAAARLAPQVRALAISANGGPARHAMLELPVLADIIGGHRGPLAGIHAGLVWAAALPDAPDQVVTVAADTPFFPPDLAARLAEASGGGNLIVIAADETGTHPVFGLWPVSLSSALEHWLTTAENLSVMAFVRSQPHVLAQFGTKGDPFFNINTPDDLAEAERHMSGEAS